MSQEPAKSLQKSAKLCQTIWDPYPGPPVQVLAPKVQLIQSFRFVQIGRLGRIFWFHHSTQPSHSHCSKQSKADLATSSWEELIPDPEPRCNPRQVALEVEAAASPAARAREAAVAPLRARVAAALDAAGKLFAAKYGGCDR